MSTPARTEIHQALTADGHTRDVYLADGQIVAVDTPPPDWTADTRIDASGLWLLPGATDLCARLGEADQADRATAASELPVMAAAGIATTCLPPDASPCIDSGTDASWTQQQSDACSGSRVVLLGALTDQLGGTRIAPLHTLMAAGCRGVSQPDGLPQDLLALRRALSYAAGQDVLVHLRPRMTQLAPKACLHDGGVAARRGMDGEPASAESIAVATAIELAADTGARLHLGRLSAARSVALIRQAKSDGVAVTCDLAVHQLLLTEEDCEGLHPRLHLSPPLRTARDRDALLAGVLDGTIDAVCSDHRPHGRDAKTNPLPMTPPGGVTAELLLPALHTALAGQEDRQARMQQLVVHGPAAVLRLPPAALDAGQPADCVLFDPAPDWTVDEAELASAGSHSPLHGVRLRGQVRPSWVQGRPFE